ncbi:hypothetical protein KKH56_07560, partial [bacterium]|nr:hypothetical protein [bacterium]
DTDVNPNTRYYYRVKACSNSACSSYSNEISPAAPTQDATPPLSFNLLLPENDSWTNDSSPTFAWGSSDDLESVLDGYFLYLDEALDTSLPPTTVSTKPSAPLSDGYYIWKVQAKNGQGLTTSSDTSLVKIDISKPVTTLAVSPLEYDSGPVRYIAPTATISLFSNDTGSGVLQTNYRIDHKGNWKSYASAITILEEGEHTLSYLSVDTAGNREDTATPIFFIDQTPPLTSDDAPSGWRSDAVTVNLISNDTGCGAASTYYAINQQSFTSGSRVDIDSSGTYSIRYYSIDNLGNKEDTKTAAYEIKIDTSPPNGTPLAPLEKGEYSTSDTIEFVLSFEDISDLESGISSYLVEVSTAEGDSQEIEVSGTSLVVSSCEEGKTYYARVKARNRAGLYGNYSDTSDGITIDTVWPSLLNGYFDARDKQVVLHFSERVTDPIGSQIKVNGVPLTGQEDINETAGGKTLTISVNKADSIELDENSLKDIAGNPIGKTRRSLYLLAGAGEEADLKVAIENRSGQALAFRCQDEGQIGDTLGQMIEQADEKAKTDPKISRMLETAYQIEAITPQGEDCGENLGGLILLEIPYEEEDDINLRAYRLNKESSQWELIEDGEINEPDGSKKVVRVEVDHLSLFSLGIARQANPDLTGAKAYPNPFIPGNATTYGASGITFDKLTEDAEIKIFTIAGELVKTLRAKYGEAVWETVNENGREVASGIYIYLITDSQDGKKTGKIAIIR